MIAIHLTGYISEQQVALYYAKQGYIIYWPNHSQSSCDFIACKDQEVIRVQVKSAYWIKRETGREYLQTTVRKGSGRNDSYTIEHCDVVAAYGDNRLWIIPIEAIGKLQSLVLAKRQVIRKSYVQDWDKYEVKL